jgi:hypothetical protein
MLDNLLFFQFSGIKNVRCLFHGKNFNTENSLGSIAFDRGEENKIILENREYLFKKLSMPVLEVHQIHSSILHFTPKQTLYAEKASLEGDGIATNSAKHALLIKTADCQPILLAHKKGQHIMALHVGWRGNRNDFILQAVAEFCKEYKLLARDLFAVRGPSLGPQEAEFTNFSAEWGDAYKEWYTVQTQTLDLWTLTRHQLKQAGLLQENIYGIDFCTKTMSKQYFSHRENNQTGRQASIIWFE